MCQPTSGKRPLGFAKLPAAMTKSKATTRVLDKPPTSIDENVGMSTQVTDLPAELIRRASRERLLEQNIDRRASGKLQGDHFVPQDEAVSVQFCLQLSHQHRVRAPATCSMQGVRCQQTSVVRWNSAGPPRQALPLAAIAAISAARHLWPAPALPRG